MTAVLSYRLYHVRDGHFVRSYDIKASSDAEAEERAREWLGSEAAELWCGERKVRIFPGGPGPAAG